MATTSTTTTTTTVYRTRGKRDLKAFVRYDGSGRVIPSSVILARKQPKVGNWVEINAYECCNPSTTPTYPTTICVAGFLGAAEFNGTYTYIWHSDGKPQYRKGTNYDVYWDASTQQWWIGDVASSLEGNGVANPTLVSEWDVISGGGILPVTVTEGECTTTTTTSTTSTTTTVRP